LKVVLGTKNQGKIKEIKDIFKKEGIDVEILGLDLFPEMWNIEESGKTFLENALIKAKTVAEHTKMISIADDSGLEIDALNGAPGIYSARFAGPEADDEKNNKKVLDLLKDVPEEKRTARFRCVIVAYRPDGKYISAEGTWEGRITLYPRGDKGFGYDPIFEDLELGLTAAEMEPEEKNKRSHRYKAIKKLLKIWHKLFE